MINTILEDHIRFGYGFLVLDEVLQILIRVLMLDRPCCCKGGRGCDFTMSTTTNAEIIAKVPVVEVVLAGKVLGPCRYLVLIEAIISE